MTIFAILDLKTIVGIGIIFVELRRQMILIKITTNYNVFGAINGYRAIRAAPNAQWNFSVDKQFATIALTTDFGIIRRGQIIVATAFFCIFFIFFVACR